MAKKKAAKKIVDEVTEDELLDIELPQEIIEDEVVEDEIVEEIVKPVAKKIKRGGSFSDMLRQRAEEKKKKMQKLYGKKDKAKK